MSLIRAFSVLALAALLPLVPGCDTRRRFPERTDIDKLEAEIALPTSARRLGSYSRYYWLVRSNSDRELMQGCSVPPMPRSVTTYPLIRGRYIFRPQTGDGPGIYFTRRPERWCDGGCDIVELLYDPQKRRVLSLACNGWEVKELP